MGGMGFRDLRVFNEALLAKQCWRLAVGDDSLLHRVLRAKYYPKCSFLEAYRGGSPSYTWRSIWAAKSLLLEGLRWRIGNGRKVLVWEDNWIPCEGFIACPSTDKEFNPDLWVHDLIDEENLKWRNEIINKMFSEEAAHRILAMPLSFQFSDDLIQWWPNKDGIFSVKSAYWLGKLRSPSICKIFDENHMNDKWWTMLWRMNIIPKLKHFRRRACKGMLPTKETLKKRHILNDDTCLRCKQGSETEVHALFECQKCR